MKRRSCSSPTSDPPTSKFASSCAITETTSASLVSPVLPPLLLPSGIPRSKPRIPLIRDTSQCLSPVSPVKMAVECSRPGCVCRGRTKNHNKNRHFYSGNSTDHMNIFRLDEHINENGDGCSSLSVNELSMEEAACGQQQYPAVFRWTGAGQDVSLSGSFNSWRDKIPLVKSHGEFYTVVEIAGGTHQYKYFVDGEWVCHPNEPKIDNGMGSQNNVLTIKSEDCDIYRVLASDSLGTTVADPTASPPGNYSQYVPSKDTGFGFHRLGPPLLPPHLLDTVLNKEVPAHCEPMMVPEPNHVVINHLFTLSIKGGVMVLGTTHRYRKKYITTLLYKPI